MFILAETLGNIFKWYSSPNELITENITSLYEYSYGELMIANKISEEDIELLNHPKNKTYGIFFVKCVDMDPNCQNAVTDYAFPFNDDAVVILKKYNMSPPENRLSIMDFDSSYSGAYKVEAYDIWDHRSTSTTIKLALFTLTGDQLKELIDQIKTRTGYDITPVGHIDNEMTKSIHFVFDHAPDCGKVVEDILTGRLGVIKLESSW